MCFRGSIHYSHILHLSFLMEPKMDLSSSILNLQKRFHSHKLFLNFFHLSILFIYRLQKKDLTIQILMQRFFYFMHLLYSSKKDSKKLVYESYFLYFSIKERNIMCVVLLVKRETPQQTYKGFGLQTT